MTRALLRSMASATAALAVVGLGELTYFAALCPAHKAWVRTSTNPAAVVRDSGFNVARPGDAIYVCTTPHCAGSWCHEDRGCICAAANLGAPALGQLVGGECTLDKAKPTRSDDFGACRYARCDTHVN